MMPHSRQSTGSAPAIALAVFTVLAVVVMLPASLEIGARPLAWFEGSGIYHRLWWFGEVLRGNGGSLFQLAHISAPEGMPLAWQSNGLGRELIFSALGGHRWPQLYGNLFTLTIPITVAFVAFCFLYRLLHGAFWPALLGGWFCGWNGFVIEHLVHPWLAGVEGLVLFIGMLVLLRRRVTIRRAVGAGLAASLAGWFSAQSLVYVAAISLVFLADCALRRDWRGVIALGSAGLIGLILCWPLLADIRRAFTGWPEGLSGGNPELAMMTWRATLLNLFLPPKAHPLFGWAGELLRDRGLAVTTANEPYLGAVVLPLAVLGALSRRRGTRFLVAVALTGVVFALGPAITFLQEPGGLPGPFRLLAEVPPFNSLRTPGRMMIVAHLAMGMLAAFGLLSLLRWGPIRRFPGGRGLLIVGVLMLHMVDRNAWGTRTYPETRTGFWSEVAREPGEFAVLDFPHVRGMDHYMHYGAYHQKGVIWGFGGRAPAEWLDARERDLRWALLGTVWPDEWPTDHARFAASLRAYRVRYLVLHENHLTSHRTMWGLRGHLIRLIEDPLTWEGQNWIEPPILIWQDHVVRAYLVRFRCGALEPEPTTSANP